jgi:methionyl-tRNA synthetase
MLTKYRGGCVPEARLDDFWILFTQANAPDQRDWLTRVQTSIEKLEFRDALETIWELVAALNRLIDERKPWELHKTGKEEELDIVLSTLCEGLRRLAHLLFPFMPGKATEIWRQLGLEGEPNGNWERVLRAANPIPPHTQTKPAEAPLFPRLDLIPA